LPGVVPLARALDLDHFGAQVGKELGRPGTGKDTREVQDSDTVEDSVHDGGVNGFGARFVTGGSGL
jgi:hypothetical protein